MIRFKTAVLIGCLALWAGGWGAGCGGNGPDANTNDNSTDNTNVNDNGMPPDNNNGDVIDNGNVNDNGQANDNDNVNDNGTDNDNANDNGQDVTCEGDAECDDGEACNGQETCADGICVSGEPLDCDDGDACTIDSCEDGACRHTPFICAQGLTCVEGVCRCSADEVCDDGNPCTIDLCEENVCTHEGVQCEAGSNCDPATGDCISGATTLRINVNSQGQEANDASSTASVSADGRFVAFSSRADTLVPDDTNGVEDVFLHDRATGQTVRVSIGPAGAGGNGASARPSISADGCHVVFNSWADNLIDRDTNETADIFVYDCQSGTVSRVSEDSDGQEADLLSNGGVLSEDGQIVAFSSFASNLVEGDTNGNADVFVHDRQTGETVRVSISSDGAQGDGASVLPSISADGRIVAFRSLATNLVEDDTNGSSDVFVTNLDTGEISRVSVASDGVQANADSEWSAISADGNVVGFASLADNLVNNDDNGQSDVFVHELSSGQTLRVSISSGGAGGNGASQEPSLSADGRYVVFRSLAGNLVTGDTNGTYDVFMHDRQNVSTVRVSVTAGGLQSAGSATLHYPCVSSDGRVVAFSSAGADLIPGDTNGASDVFVRVLGE